MPNILTAELEPDFDILTSSAIASATDLGSLVLELSGRYDIPMLGTDGLQQEGAPARRVLLTVTEAAKSIMAIPPEYSFDDIENNALGGPLLATLASEGGRSLVEA